MSKTETRDFFNKDNDNLFFGRMSIKTRDNHVDSRKDV